MDLLTDLQLVRRLAPWAANVGKRLVNAPEVYVRNSGIVHALLGLEEPNALLGHSVVGSSHQGFGQACDHLCSTASPDRGGAIRRHEPPIAE